MPDGGAVLRLENTRTPSFWTPFPRLLPKETAAHLEHQRRAGSAFGDSPATCGGWHNNLLKLCCPADMTMMVLSRLEELQDCFPQLPRGTIEGVLDQVLSLCCARSAAFSLLA